MTQISPNLAAAIVAVCREVRQLGADDRNKHGGYNFVSVDKFYAAVGPIMASHGLSTIAHMARSEVVETTNDDGKTRSHLHTEWDIFLIHESGDVYGPVRRDVTVVASGPQAYASAESFITKYFLRSTFKIPTGDKDDADLQEATPIPARRASAPTPTNGSSAANDRIRQFVTEVNERLDQLNNSLPDFVDWVNSNPTVDQRLNKLDSGSFDHIEGVKALRDRIAALS